MVKGRSSWRPLYRILEGSFSAVSKPILANKHLLLLVFKVILQIYARLHRSANVYLLLDKNVHLILIQPRSSFRLRRVRTGWPVRGSTRTRSRASGSNAPGASASLTASSAKPSGTSPKNASLDQENAFYCCENCFSPPLIIECVFLTISMISCIENAFFNCKNPSLAKKTVLAKECRFKVTSNQKIQIE